MIQSGPFVTRSLVRYQSPRARAPCANGGEKKRGRVVVVEAGRNQLGVALFIHPRHRRLSLALSLSLFLYLDEGVPLAVQVGEDAVLVGQAAVGAGGLGWRGRRAGGRRRVAGGGGGGAHGRAVGEEDEGFRSGVLSSESLRTYRLGETGPEPAALGGDTARGQAHRCAPAGAGARRRAAPSLSGCWRESLVPVHRTAAATTSCSVFLLSVILPGQQAPGGGPGGAGQHGAGRERTKKRKSARAGCCAPAGRGRPRALRGRALVGSRPSWRKGVRARAAVCLRLGATPRERE